MFVHLFVLCLSALPTPATFGDVAPCGSLAFAASRVSAHDRPLAALLVVTGAEESRARGGVVGDRGLARGRFQLHPEWRRGRRAEELDDDATLDAGLARDALLSLVQVCGTREAAVRAYASGSCDRAGNIARRRCARAGGC